MTEPTDSQNAEQMHAINEQIAAAQSELRDVEQSLAAVDAELDALAGRRPQFAVLQQAVESLRRLEEHDAAHLFWSELTGEPTTPGQGAEKLAAISRRIDEFDKEVHEVETRRREVLSQIDDRNEQIDFLAEDLFDLEEEDEARRQEWVIERPEPELSQILQVMPWARGFEEDRQFRKALLSSLAVSLLLGLIIPLIDLPILEREAEFEVPERFAQLIQKPEPKPAPPPQPALAEVPEEELPEPEQQPEPEELQPEETPKVAEKPVPESAKQPSTRERVATRGILAFRESFSNLASSRPSAKLGAEARVSNAGAQGRPERRMVTTLAAGSSGGINLSAVSRDVGGGGGDMTGVEAGQVASSIASAGGVDRPLSAGASAGRTDEEIQIVFDRYKAALYRLYNRELRKDPTLRGQLVLQLTIEPDGTVSLCRLQASDMGAPELAQQVVSRVKTFDFGAKEVPPVTIVYPIDFLPTA